MHNNQAIPATDVAAFITQLINQPSHPVEDAISRINRQTALMHAARQYVIAARSFLEEYTTLETALERYPQTELPAAVRHYLEGGQS